MLMNDPRWHSDMRRSPSSSFALSDSSAHNSRPITSSKWRGGGEREEFSLGEGLYTLSLLLFALKGTKNNSFLCQRRRKRRGKDVKKFKKKKTVMDTKSVIYRKWAATEGLTDSVALQEWWSAAGSRSSSRLFRHRPTPSRPNLPLRWFTRGNGRTCAFLSPELEGEGREVTSLVGLLSQPTPDFYLEQGEAGWLV